MANIRVVSCLAESIGMGIRLMAEGHQVDYYIHESGEKDCGDGIITKVDDWRQGLEEKDLLIFDDLDQKVEGEGTYKPSAWSAEVREKYPGLLIIGGGHPDVARLENDRMFAQSVMETYGIPTVPMERFTSFEDAKKFLQEHPGAWALKHNNQVNRNAAKVAKDADSMIEFIDWLEANWTFLGGGKPVDFVLQEAAPEGGVEFAVTCFFDGQRFRSEVCYLNQEEKKLMDGQKGPSTGQMGEIGFCVPNARLFRETLAKIEPFLQGKNYCGFADCNCIVGPDFLVPLEFTIGRPGYPTLYSWLEMLAEPVGDWLIRMAKQDPAPVQAYDAVNCTLVLATGSFPEPDETQAKLAVLNGLDKTGLEHVWLGEVRFDQDKFMGAGTMGYLAVVTNKGRSIPDAARRAYGVIDELSVVPFEIMRMDIGRRAMEEFEKLEAWGWLE